MLCCHLGVKMLGTENVALSDHLNVNRLRCSVSISLHPAPAHNEKRLYNSGRFSIVSNAEPYHYE